MGCIAPLKKKYRHFVGGAETSTAPQFVLKICHAEGVLTFLVVRRD
jgi:hypothetical protein